MQYSQQPNFPPLFPSFKRHRSSIEHSRFKLDITLPVLSSAPVWASLPTPPMSGSPPPQQSPSPKQIAGRRRKRSESLPPITTSASLASNLPRGPATYGQPLLTDPQTSYHQPQPPSYPAPYSGAQSMAYAAGPVTATLANPIDIRYPGGHISPQTTRKNKAHVASACINCKKKHLRCDNARPCRRCVQSGKEDTCQDVVHKKRGRPPLRPEEPSARRSFDASILSDMSRRMQTTDPSSYAQTGQYGRPSFRPLQAQPSYEAHRSHFRPGQPYGLYAAPSIGPSAATATGQFVSARGYGQTQQMPPQVPSPYAHPAAQPSRPLAPYPQPYGYQAPADHMRPPTSQVYSTPLFPRNQRPPPHDSASTTAGPTSLQLPPIRPAVHSMDSAPSQTEQRYAPQPPIRDSREGNGTTRQPDPKRPKMDIQGILGPKHD